MAHQKRLMFAWEPMAEQGSSRAIGIASRFATSAMLGSIGSANSLFGVKSRLIL
jgi:hypothetical protein